MAAGAELALGGVLDSAEIPVVKGDGADADGDVAVAVARLLLRTVGEAEPVNAKRRPDFPGFHGVSFLCAVWRLIVPQGVGAASLAGWYDGAGATTG